MDIDQLLRELSAALGLPGLELDEHRSCALVFDEDLHTELRYDERADVLCLYADLGRARPGTRDALASQLLSANHHEQADGSHFTLTPAHDDVVLCRMLDAEKPSVERLVAELEDLVSSSRRWRSRFENADAIVRWSQQEMTA